jgi:hypothetical protein
MVLRHILGYWIREVETWELINLLVGREIILHGS